MITEKQYLEYLIKQYQNLIYSICLKSVGNPFDAEDLTQEVFLSAYKNLSRFDGNYEKAWLSKIAVRKCLDYLKAAPLPEKFGAPRQSGLVEELEGKIILDSPYNVKEAFDGIEEFSHLWILWQFSDSIRDEFSPTVRPPRLGGEKRKGVFATRSPFRPNNIGLSCVKLIKVEQTKEHGTVLTVGGVDMKSGTPIYDIKPYIKYADCRPEAKSSFADLHEADRLEIEISDNIKSLIPSDKINALTGILSCDPRPAYQNDSNRIYGISFDNMNVKFKVDGNKLTVLEIVK